MKKLLLLISAVFILGLIFTGCDSVPGESGGDGVDADLAQLIEDYRTGVLEEDSALLTDVLDPDGVTQVFSFKGDTATTTGEELRNYSLDYTKDEYLGICTEEKGYGFVDFQIDNVVTSESSDPASASADYTLTFNTEVPEGETTKTIEVSFTGKLVFKFREDSGDWYIASVEFGESEQTGETVGEVDVSKIYKVAGDFFAGVKSGNISTLQGVLADSFTLTSKITPYDSTDTDSLNSFISNLKTKLSTDSIEDIILSSFPTFIKDESEGVIMFAWMGGRVHFVGSIATSLQDVGLFMAEVGDNYQIDMIMISPTETGIK